MYMGWGVPVLSAEARPIRRGANWWSCDSWRESSESSSSREGSTMAWALGTAGGGSGGPPAPALHHPCPEKTSSSAPHGQNAELKQRLAVSDKAEERIS